MEAKTVYYSVEVPFLLLLPVIPTYDEYFRQILLRVFDSFVPFRHYKYYYDCLLLCNERFLVYYSVLAARGVTS